MFPPAPTPGAQPRRGMRCPPRCERQGRHGERTAEWKMTESAPSAGRAERRGKGLDIGRPPRHDLRGIMSHPVCRPDRDPLAPPAARLRAGKTGLRALRRTADRRHLRPTQRPPGPGLIPAVWITAAGISDNPGVVHPLSRIAAANPRVTEARTDTCCRTKAIAHGDRLPWGHGVACRVPG
jgi:hypothetical protein